MTPAQEARRTDPVATAVRAAKVDAEARAEAASLAHFTYDGGDREEDLRLAREAAAASVAVDALRYALCAYVDSESDPVRTLRAGTGAGEGLVGVACRTARLAAADDLERRIAAPPEPYDVVDLAAEPKTVVTAHAESTSMGDLY